MNCTCVLIWNREPLDCNNIKVLYYNATNYPVTITVCRFCFLAKVVAVRSPFCGLQWSDWV